MEFVEFERNTEPPTDEELHQLESFPTTPTLVSTPISKLRHENVSECKVIEFRQDQRKRKLVTLAFDLDDGDNDGASSSSEFISPHTSKRTRLKKDDSEFESVWQNPLLAWPSDEATLFEQFCRDSDFRQYQRECLGFAFRAFCTAKEVNDEEARKVSERMQTEDTTTLLGRIGKHFVDALYTKLKSEKVLPETSPETVVSDVITEMPQDLKPANYISSETLEQAYDQLCLEQGSSKSIHQAGKVIFEAIFTEEEKMICTISGRRGSRPYNKEKVRLLSRTIAWLHHLKSQETKTPRTFEALQEDIATHDRRLPPSEENILQIKVLTEYAYMRRKQLERKVWSRTANVAKKQ